MDSLSKYPLAVDQSGRFAPGVWRKCFSVRTVVSSLALPGRSYVLVHGYVRQTACFANAVQFIEPTSGYIANLASQHVMRNIEPLGPSNAFSRGARAQTTM